MVRLRVSCLIVDWLQDNTGMHIGSNNQFVRNSLILRRSSSESINKGIYGSLTLLLEALRVPVHRFP